MRTLVHRTLLGLILLSSAAGRSRADNDDGPFPVECPNLTGPKTELTVRIERRSVVVTDPRPECGRSAVTAELPQEIVAWIRHANFLYAASATGLLVIDVMVPRTPKIVSTYLGPAGITQLSLKDGDRQLWAVTQDAQLFRFGISKPGQLAFLNRSTLR